MMARDAQWSAGVLIAAEVESPRSLPQTPSGLPLTRAVVANLSSLPKGSHVHMLALR
jgi:hypothetical protein